MLRELVAPIVCVACGTSSDGDLCGECAEELVVLTAPICARCGGRVRRATRSCDGCESLGGFGRARSLVVYGGPASRLAVALKRRGRPGLAAHVGTLLADLAVATDLARDAVAFVPAGARATPKGFDHAEILARAVGRRLGCPVSRALRRRGKGRRQSKASLDERRANAAASFRSRPVSGRVLLVDDIYTTGATAEACALALMGAGASAVDVVTWARTLRQAKRAGPP